MDMDMEKWQLDLSHWVRHILPRLVDDVGYNGPDDQ